MLIISSFEYGVKLTILGLHSGFSSKRGNIRSVKSKELAIPLKKFHLKIFINLISQYQILTN